MAKNHTFPLYVVPVVAALATLVSVLSVYGTRLTAAVLFPDVPSTHPNYTAVLFARSRGIVEGYPDGMFRPDSNLSRAEFVKVLMKPLVPARDIQECLGHPSSQPLFDDVEDPSAVWYGGPLCMAKNAGVIRGYPDGSFQPARTVNVAEAITAIQRVYRLAEREPAEGEEWYEPAMRELRRRDALPPSVQTVDRPITRGEIIEILYRVIRSGAVQVHGVDGASLELSTLPTLHFSAGTASGQDGGRPRPRLEGGEEIQDDSEDDESIEGAGGEEDNEESVASSSSVSSARPTVPDGYPVRYHPFSYEEVRDRKFAFLDRNGSDFEPSFDIYGFIAGVRSADPGFHPTIDFLLDNREFFGIDDEEKFRDAFSDSAAPQLPKDHPLSNLATMVVMPQGITGHWWPGLTVPTVPVITEEQVREKFLDKEIVMKDSVKKLDILVEGKLRKKQFTGPGNWGLGWRPCQPPAECPFPDDLERASRVRDEYLTVTLRPAFFKPDETTQVIEVRLLYTAAYRAPDSAQFIAYIDAMTGNELTVKLRCEPREAPVPSMDGADPAILSGTDADPEQEVPSWYPSPALPPVTFPDRVREFMDRIMDFVGEALPDSAFSIFRSMTMPWEIVSDDRLVPQPYRDVPAFYAFDPESLRFEDWERAEWEDFSKRNGDLYGIDDPDAVRTEAKELSCKKYGVIVDAEIPDQYNLRLSSEEAAKDWRHWPQNPPWLRFTKIVGDELVGTMPSSHHYREAKLPSRPKISREEIEERFVDQWEFRGEPLRRENLMILLGPAVFRGKIRLVYWVGTYDHQSGELLRVWIDDDGEVHEDVEPDRFFADDHWIAVIDAMTGEDISSLDGRF